MKVKYRYDDTKREIARTARNIIENDGIVIVQITSHAKTMKQTICKVQDFEFGVASGYGYDVNMKFLSELFNMMFLKELYIFFKTLDYKYVATHNHFTDIENLRNGFKTFHYNTRWIETHESMFLLIEKEQVSKNVYINRES